MIVWLNGSFVPVATAHIDPADRGFTLADGVFDTMLAVDGQPQEALAHFTRLARHAGILDLALPQPAAMLMDVAFELLQQNKFLDGRYAIRTTLSRGTGARGLTPPDPATPTLLMRAAPATKIDNRPLKLIIAGTTRRNEFSPLSRIKSLNYGDQILALNEARRHGADDAILLNTAGNIACATTSNVVIRENGRLVTPPLTAGVLDGITRRSLLDRHGGTEETISVDRLQMADEILLTNSVAGVRVGELA